uniref:Uncharacterized protein n=1 Tax=Sphaerodactylus townsendi TaxID=933632 RepID=A0ACB8EU76_9SAUR
MGTVERLHLTTFLARSQELARRVTREADKQQRAYAALQLRTTELQLERDQLRADLSTLQTQVAALMADRDREGPLRTESTMADYVTGNLTIASDTPTQRATILTPRHQANLTATQQPHQSFRVTFSGDPDELAFFLIQAGSYMEVHGAGFQTDHERVFELGTQLRGEAANWLVGLVETNAVELYDLEQFLLALRLRFEDPLTEEKARDSLQRLRQGTRCPTVETNQWGSRDIDGMDPESGGS